MIAYRLEIIYVCLSKFDKGSFTDKAYKLHVSWSQNIKLLTYTRILEKFVSVSLMLELARILSEGKGYKSLNRTWPGSK